MTGLVRLSRDKYFNRYETGQLNCRIETADRDQGLVTDAADR